MSFLDIKNIHSPTLYNEALALAGKSEKLFTLVDRMKIKEPRNVTFNYANAVNAIETAEMMGEYKAADAYRVLCGRPPKHEPYYDGLANFYTVDPETIALCNLVRKLAYTNHPVLIRGQTGVGKELLAQALHGPWRPGPLVAINCAAIPPLLAEAELFGYEAGSFTGATSRRDGVFQQAFGGTLFLDEVFELPDYIQAKLLRALQPDTTGRCYIRRVGGQQDEISHCRIVCASRGNELRQDFYARISTFELNVKPLSKRPEDAMHIWSKLYPGFSYPTDAKLLHNVRSLIAIGERMKLDTL